MSSAMGDIRVRIFRTRRVHLHHRVAHTICSHTFVYEPWSYTNHTSVGSVVYICMRQYTDVFIYEAYMSSTTGDLRTPGQRAHLQSNINPMFHC